MKRTVLITGGTSGIGLGLAKLYLARGDKVIITGRNKDKVDKVTLELSQYNNFLLGAVVDVRHSEDMQQFIIEMDDKYILDIVIANAGVSMGVMNTKEITNVAKEIFDINVYGVFNTIHPVIDRMKERKQGHIVLISSMAGFFGLKSAVFYAASKSAIRSYGEGLRLLLKEYNIEVSTVFPGFVESNITRANSFKMMFFMSTNKAVNIMVTKLDNKQGFILFPFRMRVLVYLLNILPFHLREKILHKLPNKNTH